MEVDTMTNTMTDESRAQDSAAIRRLVSDAETLQSDLEGYTRLLTDDVVIVNIAGRRVHGRDAIYQAMKAALATPLANVLTTHAIDSMVFLRPDVALVSCNKHVLDRREPSPGGDDPAFPLNAKLTFVVVKEQGNWLIASAQTTPEAGS
jgi:uncharacterized protein (TIGR02246 family)